MKFTRRRFSALAGTAGLLGPMVSMTALAQSFPSRAVHLIVPNPPGGGTDFIARLLAPKLSQDFGQPVVIENKPGVSGNVAAQFVVNAAPDGHTVLMVTGSYTVNPTLLPSLGYDPMNDLKPITQAILISSVVVAHPSVAANNVKELIALSKGSPKGLNAALTGSGQGSHLLFEQLIQSAGLNATLVPYSGSGAAVNALLGGHVDLGSLPASVALQHIKAGKLKALAVTGPARNALLPDLPTVRESGFDIEVTTWHGFLVPGRTPDAVVSQLHAAFVRALALPDVNSRIVADGLDVVGSTPQQFGAVIRAETKKWGDLIRNSKIKTQ
ncbi:tripartite tricarboxylate transporter substrate binding protein [Comamonadaceae bacterium G21597-S1]|nr:tripartite tricarboxylate transporter substrate binding protein [Comamonadaceae bacterium G21597-S1]